MIIFCNVGSIVIDYTSPAEDKAINEILSSLDSKIKSNEITSTPPIHDRALHRVCIILSPGQSAENYLYCSHIESLMPAATQKKDIPESARKESLASLRSRDDPQLIIHLEHTLKSDQMTYADILIELVSRHMQLPGLRKENIKNIYVLPYLKKCSPLLNIIFDPTLSEEQRIRALNEHLKTPKAKQELNKDVYDHGMTAVMYAGQYDLASTVQVLCEHGADVSLENRNGETALTLTKEGTVSSNLLKAAHERQVNLERVTLQPFLHFLSDEKSSALVTTGAKTVQQKSFLLTTNETIRVHIFSFLRPADIFSYRQTARVAKDDDEVYRLIFPHLKSTDTDYRASFHDTHKWHQRARIAFREFLEQSEADSNPINKLIIQAVDQRLEGTHASLNHQLLSFLFAMREEKMDRRECIARAQKLIEEPVREIYRIGKLGLTWNSHGESLDQQLVFVSYLFSFIIKPLLIERELQQFADKMLTLLEDDAVNPAIRLLAAELLMCCNIHIPQVNDYFSGNNYARAEHNHKIQSMIVRSAQRDALLPCIQNLSVTREDVTDDFQFKKLIQMNARVLISTHQLESPLFPATAHRMVDSIFDWVRTTRNHRTRVYCQLYDSVFQLHTILEAVKLSGKHSNLAEAICGKLLSNAYEEFGSDQQQTLEGPEHSSYQIPYFYILQLIDRLYSLGNELHQVLAAFIRSGVARLATGGHPEFTPRFYAEEFTLPAIDPDLPFTPMLLVIAGHNPNDNSLDTIFTGLLRSVAIGKRVAALFYFSRRTLGDTADSLINDKIVPTLLASPFNMIRNLLDGYSDQPGFLAITLDRLVSQLSLAGQDDLLTTCLRHGNNRWFSNIILLLLFHRMKPADKAQHIKSCVTQIKLTSDVMRAMELRDGGREHEEKYCLNWKVAFGIVATKRDEEGKLVNDFSQLTAALRTELQTEDKSVDQFSRGSIREGIASYLFDTLNVQDPAILKEILPVLCNAFHKHNGEVLNWASFITKFADSLSSSKLLELVKKIISNLTSQFTSCHQVFLDLTLKQFVARLNDTDYQSFMQELATKNADYTNTYRHVFRHGKPFDFKHVINDPQFVTSLTALKQDVEKFKHGVKVKKETKEKVTAMAAEIVQSVVDKVLLSQSSDVLFSSNIGSIPAQTTELEASKMSLSAQ